MEREGDLERIAVDRDAVERLLGDAVSHLASSETLAGTDPSGAYQLAYDAARKAVAAHMAGHGYRVRLHRLGAHAVVARYAETAITVSEVRHLDRMRRVRNRTEYGALGIGAAQLAADLEHAKAIVRAVAKELG